MLKILNVLLENYTGGPQIRVLSVANLLRNSEIETIILCPNGDGDFAQRAREGNFKVYQVTLKHPKYINNLKSIWENVIWLITFPLSVFKILQIIDKEGIDIVHVNGLLNLQASIAAFLAKRALVWHLMSLMYPKAIVSLLMPFIIRIANRIVVISENTKHYYLGDNLSKHEQNVSLIHEGIDIDKFYTKNISIEVIDKIKSDLGIKQSHSIIGCIGHVNPVKDYETFIKSAHYVHANSDKTKFIIVGDITGSQFQYYQTLQYLIKSLNMKENIIFTGKRTDIPELLSMLDVFVLSSISEGTPLAILEAMAMEKAIVTTDVGAVSEQVVNGETGIIVSPKNPEILGKAITRLLENPKERIDMGIKGRQRAIEEFSLNKCAEKHKKLYIDLFMKGSHYSTANQNANSSAL